MEPNEGKLKMPTDEQREKYEEILTNLKPEELIELCSYAATRHTTSEMLDAAEEIHDFAVSKGWEIDKITGACFVYALMSVAHLKQAILEHK